MHPQKIVVMRHAESQEDVDKTVYEHTADLDIALSPNGERQAENVTSKLCGIVQNKQTHFYISPGRRLRQTYEIMSSRFPSTMRHSFTVETLLLKQFWGDVTVENRRQIEIERYKQGVLEYRFPNGESGRQLIARFTFFEQSLRKEFDKDDFPENIVILTHGFEMRIFLMVWFGWSEQYFERLANPRNCEMAPMSLQSDGSYVLDEKMRMYDPTSNPNHVSRTKI